MSTTRTTLDRELSAALRAELVSTVDATRTEDLQHPDTLEDPRTAEPDGGTVVPLKRRSRGRTASGRTTTRLALVAASVAGLAIGASVLMPGQSAYAGWSATPTPVDGERAVAAMEACSAGFAGHYADGHAPTTDEPTWSGGLVEQRGRWQLTMVRGADGTVGECMHTLPTDGASTGGLHLPAAPAAGSVSVIANNGVLAHVSRDPRVINGWFGEPEMEGHHYITGVADAAVTEIVLDTQAGEVTASLEEGLWAAWWPVADEPGADTRPAGATLTLTDGSTVELTGDQLEELRDLDG